MNQSQIVALALAAVPLAAPFLGAFYKYLVSRVPSNRAVQIAGVVRSAVSAAEQVYHGVPGSSQAKKEFVVSRVQAVFGKHISPALVEVLLEDAVSALPHTPTPPTQSAI